MEQSQLTIFLLYPIESVRRHKVKNQKVVRNCKFLKVFDSMLHQGSLLRLMVGNLEIRGYVTSRKFNRGTMLSNSRFMKNTLLCRNYATMCEYRGGYRGGTVFDRLGHLPRHGYTKYSYYGTKALDDASENVSESPIGTKISEKSIEHVIPQFKDTSKVSENTIGTKVTPSAVQRDDAITDNFIKNKVTNEEYTMIDNLVKGKIKFPKEEKEVTKNTRYLYWVFENKFNYTPTEHTIMFSQRLKTYLQALDDKYAIRLTIVIGDSSKKTLALELKEELQNLMEATVDLKNKVHKLARQYKMKPLLVKRIAGLTALFSKILTTHNFGVKTFSSNEVRELLAAMVTRIRKEQHVHHTIFVYLIGIQKIKATKHTIHILNKEDISPKVYERLLKAMSAPSSEEDTKKDTKKGIKKGIKEDTENIIDHDDKTIN